MFSLLYAMFNKYTYNRESGFVIALLDVLLEAFFIYLAIAK
jgi:hypothetical protein